MSDISEIYEFKNDFCIRIYYFRNTVALLESLKANGWQVLALSTPNPQLKLTQQLHKVPKIKKTILIIGSEGKNIFLILTLF